MPASPDQRDRSGRCAVSEPWTRPVARAIRRLPSIALSAAVSRRRGSTSSEFPLGSAVSASLASSPYARNPPSISACGRDRSATCAESRRRSIFAPAAAMPLPSIVPSSRSRSSGPAAVIRAAAEPAISVPSTAPSGFSCGMARASAALRRRVPGSKRASPESLTAAPFRVSWSTATMPAWSRRTAPENPALPPISASAAAIPVRSPTAEPAKSIAPARVRPPVAR